MAKEPPEAPGELPEVPTTWLQELALTIVLLAPSLAFIACSLRFYIRIKTKRLGADDWLIVAAMVLSIAQAVGGYIFVKAAYIGIHTWDVPAYDRSTRYIWAFVNAIIYRPILTFVRISVLLFLLRIGSAKPWVKIYVWAQIAVNLVSFIALMLAYILVCNPVGENWSPKSLGANCDKKNSFSMFTSSWTIVLDLLVLTVPFCILKGVRMALRLKVIIILMFLLGLVVTAIGAYRLQVLYARAYETPKPDPYFSIGYTTQPLESNIAIITACAPALWQLTRHWFPNVFRPLGLSHGYQGRIADIESTTQDQQKSGSGKSSFSNKIRWLRSSGSSGRGRKHRGAAEPKLAHHTIGGSSIISLKRMRGDDVEATTEIRGVSRSPSTEGFDDDDDDDDVRAYGGIVRTTKYSVTRGPTVTPPKPSYKR